MSADVLLWVIVAAMAAVHIICMPMNVRLKRIAKERRAEAKVLAKGITGQVWVTLIAALVITGCWVWLFVATGKWQFLFIGAVPFVGSRITDAAARQ